MTDDLFGADDTRAVHSIALSSYAAEPLPDPTVFDAVVDATADTLEREASEVAV